jgi:transposase-like protein
MLTDLTAPKFHDEDAARAYLEEVRWPNGASCPHCGTVDVLRMGGKAHRPGLFNCRDCKEQFSVTVGTVMERSHIPLHKWVLAVHLLTASKKGMSSHQLSRMLSVTYKTAWFMSHRVREMMSDTQRGPIGGEGKVIEADEAYHGKRETPVPSEHRKGRPFTKGGKSGGREKRPIFALVERGGEARAVHMTHVTGKNIREALVTKAHRESRLHTDESKLYPTVGKEFAKHETVLHAAKEYARGKGEDLVTTNSVEGFFGVFKRGMVGVYQHCGEQHFQRYIDEFTFRYNNRSKLGIEDAERALIAFRGAEGKRLTYRRINAA